MKIFKHYKLKPSFSKIKDEKAKDKVGVGDKPPPPSFNNLIKFDPIWSSLFEPIEPVFLNQFDPIWTNLIQFEPILSDLNQIFNLIQFEPILSDLNFQKWEQTNKNKNMTKVKKL